jgi:ZIP family zinc transporter
LRSLRDMTSWIAIPFAALTVVATLAGGLLAIRLRHQMHTLIALSGGVVVAVALFDVLPEAIDATGNGGRVGAFTGIGFLAFFLAHRVLVLHHRDETEQARGHPQVGALGAAGLSVHSFVDGLGIGLAFDVNRATGLLVFIAVVSHDFADGLNTVSFVLRQGGTTERARLWLAIDAIAPLLGAIVGSTVLDVSKQRLGELLALYVGFFLYMGATDLLPEAHEHPSWRRVGLTVTGFVVIFLVSLAIRR